MRKSRSTFGLILLLLANVAAAAGENLELPAEKIPGEKPGTMMSQYWLAQAEQAARRWQAQRQATARSSRAAGWPPRPRSSARPTS